MGAAAFGVAPACPLPSVALSAAYYHTLVSHTDGFGRRHNDSMGVGLPLFLSVVSAPPGAAPQFGEWVDDCATFAGCNPSGCATDADHAR